MKDKTGKARSETELSGIAKINLKFVFEKGWKNSVKKLQICKSGKFAAFYAANCYPQLCPQIFKANNLSCVTNFSKALFFNKFRELVENDINFRHRHKDGLKK